MMKANGFFFPFENNQICEKKKKIPNVNKLPSPHHNQRGLRSGFFLNNKFFQIGRVSKHREGKMFFFQEFFNPCLYQLIQLHVIENELL